MTFIKTQTLSCEKMNLLWFNKPLRKSMKWQGLDRISFKKMDRLISGLVSDKMKLEVTLFKVSEIIHRWPDNLDLFAEKISPTFWWHFSPILPSVLFDIGSQFGGDIGMCRLIWLKNSRSSKELRANFWITEARAGDISSRWLVVSRRLYFLFVRGPGRWLLEPWQLSDYDSRSVWFHQGDTRSLAWILKLKFVATSRYSLHVARQGSHEYWCVGLIDQYLRKLLLMRQMHFSVHKYIYPMSVIPSMYIKTNSNVGCQTSSWLKYKQALGILDWGENLKRYKVHTRLFL